jgi:pilus retraction protein PilT
VRRINVEALDHKAVHDMVYDIMNDAQRKHYEDTLECDFSFEIQGLARFRVNAFNQNRGAGAVFRTIPSKILSLEQLGAPKIFAELALKPRGMVLCTGPTGSGKSTTLAAMVNHLNENEYGHVLTVEDPIEFVHESKKCLVNQREVGPHTLSFANALRSALREDPDAILVGEMRDAETAEIGMRAAITGHLVLSTLHTNDAPQTIARLMNMGIAPFNITSSVSLVIAQRLARRLCNSCKREAPLPDHALLSEGYTADEVHAGITLYEAVGCNDCTAGYKGRTGIYEVMPMTDKIQAIILQGGNSMQIAEAAQASGVKNLRQSALLKARNGLTSLAEINRVTKD